MNFRPCFGVLLFAGVAGGLQTAFPMAFSGNVWLVFLTMGLLALAACIELRRPSMWETRCALTGDHPETHQHDAFPDEPKLAQRKIAA